ncbi:type II toxin-antitoxin system Phd/YefM family antitoxin [Oscillochloris sp. ZM17-4]|uniref:type II toxin-antitoxin system Phd/YefM family antitoxin n=1 Tax=Oscillochloris sp. ZM17-4 TaxID=2866714 RepID=UPI001C73695D|nr:type II toxin-antitoxin system Phd/YefM family antitoxin [Oscillochloris sp. ZM17-4]MBX0328512.1 type II toxin-antitoxin system Phd/YefM family antitoxin [Oscillochloris sp. ZM17-4]
MPTRADLNLNVDLQRGVVPISKAASSLAALIKRANATSQPVIVTQKGYPTGVLLPIGLFSALKDLAEHHGEPEPALEPEAADAIVDALPEDAAANDTEEVAPAAERPAPRRRKAAKADVVA